MIDIHSHVLPFLDDGAVDIAEMNLILSLYDSEEIRQIIATPHFMTGVFEKSYDDVKNKIIELGLKDRVLPGQEIFLTSNTITACKEGLIKGINGSNYLLVELGFDDYREDYVSNIMGLINLGYRIIIAHPERCKYFAANPFLLNDFIDLGCYFQVNGSSIEGLISHEVKNFALKLASMGLVDFLASDCHGFKRLGPSLHEAINILEKSCPGMGKIVEENSLALINNLDLVEQKREMFNEGKSIWKKMFYLR
ncbi:MAG: hypothetical protein PHQ32_04210 [Firmicutes bacterium]|nr:hypothetical protein [Bacillota bacterium]